MFQRARRNVERRPIVPRLRIFLGELVALALFRVDVDDDRLFAVLDLGECGDQCLAVVAVRDIPVGEPHRTEQVVLRRATRLAQLLELAVHPAVVLGDGLPVVVEHDDEVCIHLADDVQPLKCLSARHRAVADQGDHIFCSPREVTRLRQPRGETDRGGGVTDVKEVVRTFLRVRVARDIVVVLIVEVCPHATREHLVRVGLVGYVVDDLVRRRVKDGVQGDDRLDDAKVRTEMPTVYARASQKCVAHFLCERSALLRRKALDVRRRCDVLQIQVKSPFVG